MKAKLLEISHGICSYRKGLFLCLKVTFLTVLDLLDIIYSKPGNCDVHICIWYLVSRDFIPSCTTRVREFGSMAS